MLYPLCRREGDPIGDIHRLFGKVTRPHPHLAFVVFGRVLLLNVVVSGKASIFVLGYIVGYFTLLDMRDASVARADHLMLKSMLAKLADG